MLSVFNGAGHIDFLEAVRFLADKAGMKMPESRRTKVRFILRKKAIEAATEAARFYRNLLHAPEGGRRWNMSLAGISAAGDQPFGIGYSPDDWDRLYTFLKQKGFDEQRCLRRGWSSKKRQAL
jgi:DNA primase